MNESYIFLEVHYDELHNEAHVIPRMEAMPNSKECESGYLTIKLGSEEFQPFINVFCTPMVCVNVEGLDIVIIFCSIFESK